MFLHHKVQSDILYEMQKNGLAPESTSLYADGKIHRYFVTGDKPGSLNGWYIIYFNEIIIVIFGSWRTGTKHVWTSENRINLSPIEKSKYFKQIAKAKKDLEDQKDAEYKKAAERARTLWESLIAANPFHPYLVKKRILSFSARQTGADLVLPIIDCNYLIQSLQYIDPHGNKYFLSGGKKKGNFILVKGNLSSTGIGIAEGFATATTLATLHPHMCMLAALDAGNLEPVALSVRRHNPLSIFGDDDRGRDDNPGSTNALQAAIAVGGEFYLPDWPVGAPAHLTDFNDLVCWLEETNREVADE